MTKAELVQARWTADRIHDWLHLFDMPAKDMFAITKRQG